MRIAKITILVSLILLGKIGIIYAGTLRVEQLGTGEFVRIQDAVDAASDGDTILIGPGHYQDMHEVSLGGYTPMVVVSWGDERSLTFIGVGPDQVLLGPDQYIEDDLGPRGIHHYGSDLVRVSGISFQNFFAGIYTESSCEVENCRFTSSNGGLIQYGGNISRVSNCEFINQQRRGNGVGVWGAAQLTIEDCLFEDDDIYIDGVSYMVVSECVFNGRVGGIVGSTGVFRNNKATINFQNRLGIISGSHILIQDCEFSVFSEGTHTLSIVDSGTYVELIDNSFNGGSYATIEIRSHPTVVGSGNHFFRGSGDDTYSIRLQHWSTPYLGSIDLRNNYWGTDDPDLVSDWIWDGVDDPEIAIEVQYLPIADGPLPTEKTSFGGLKAMYRGTAE